MGFPATVGKLTIDYATLGGRAYEPSAAGQRLEFWTGSAWRSVPAAIEIDYRNQAEFALLQGSGTARWTYRFPPVRTTRLRVLLTQPENLDPGHRCYAVREIRATAGSTSAVTAGFHVVGALPAHAGLAGTRGKPGRSGSRRPSLAREKSGDRMASPAPDKPRYA